MTPFAPPRIDAMNPATLVSGRRPRTRPEMKATLVFSAAATSEAALGLVSGSTSIYPPRWARLTTLR